MGDTNGTNKAHYLDSADLAAVIIGLGFLTLVGVIFVITLRTMNNNMTGFLTVWTAVGPIVGVVIGTMPAYFFRRDAWNARKQAAYKQEENTSLREKMAGMQVEMEGMREKMADTGAN
jgi:hypothetical protein